MKYANKFQNQTAYNTWKSGSSYVTPNVGFISSTGELIYQKFINSNGHDYVDLGLPSGTLWATVSIGASSPEQLGGFYSWGETSTKSNYTWETYAFGTENNLTKYNDSDGKTRLDLEDDVAHVLWGGDWHIPTAAQIDELAYYTQYNFDMTSEGVIGYESTINGGIMYYINGGPECGVMNGNRISSQYNRIFLSSDLSDNGRPGVLSDEGEGYGLSNAYPRYYGFQVRAVIGTLDIFTPSYQSIPR